MSMICMVCTEVTFLPHRGVGHQDAHTHVHWNTSRSTQVGKYYTCPENYSEKTVDANYTCCHLYVRKWKELYQYGNPAR